MTNIKNWRGCFFSFCMFFLVGLNGFIFLCLAVLFAIRYIEPPHFRWDIKPRWEKTCFPDCYLENVFRENFDVSFHLWIENKAKQIYVEMACPISFDFNAKGYHAYVMGMTIRSHGDSSFLIETTDSFPIPIRFMKNAAFEVRKKGVQYRLYGCTVKLAKPTLPLRWNDTLDIDVTFMISHDSLGEYWGHYRTVYGATRSDWLFQ